MKKAVLLFVMCAVMIAAIGVGTSDALVWKPGDFFGGFPNAELWFFDMFEWNGTSGTHAIAATDWDDGWLYGAELDGVGNPTAFYLWDMILDQLWVGPYNPSTGNIIWQRIF